MKLWISKMLKLMVIQVLYRVAWRKRSRVITNLKVTLSHFHDNNSNLLGVLKAWVDVGNEIKEYWLINV